MNGKKSTTIKNKAIGIQLEWVQSLLDTEEAQKVTHSNLQEMLPKQTHLWAQGQLYNSAFSLKHIKNIIKKLVAIDPKRNIWKITLEEVKGMMHQ